MSQPPCIDANVFLRFLTNDMPEQAERSRALLEQVEKGDLTVTLPEHHVFEVVFTLNRFYRMPRRVIAEQMTDLLSLPQLQLAHKSVFLDAIAIFAASSVSFADAYTVAMMRTNAITHIFSWDRDFDQFSGITRLDPPNTTT